MPKISPAEILSSVPPSDGNFKSALKAASFDELQEAIQRRQATGHKGALKALSDEVARRGVEAHGKPKLALPDKNAEALTVITGPGLALKRWVKKKPDSKAFVRLWLSHQKRKIDWLVEALKLGLVAEAVKAELPHGEFNPWLQKTLSQAVTEVDLVSSIRTIRVYRQVARAYWEENEKWEGRALTNDALVKLKGPKLDEGIRKFIGDRTLQEMLDDLHEATVAANAEVAAEDRAKSLKDAEADAKAQGKKSPVPTKEEAARIQMEIRWDEAAETLHRSLSATKEVVDTLPLARLEEAKRVAEEQLKLITVRFEALKREAAEADVAKRIAQNTRPKA